MRIGFDAKRLFNNFTGLGNHSRTTIDILTDEFPENDYLLYTPKITHNDITTPYLQKGNCQTIKPTGMLRGSIWRTFELVSRVKADKIDIFHGLSNELPVGINRSGVRSVVTIHDVAFKTFPDMYHKIDRYIYDVKWKHAVETADRIIAISQCTKDDIIRFYNVDEEKIDVVYQPVAPLFYNPITKTRCEPYMLYVGSVNSRKNLLGIVKAMELLPKDFDLPLYIVGEGREYKTQVQTYIAEHGMEGRFKWLGGLTPNELHQLYTNAQLFIYPSFYEGFGLPVVEAMLSGCPVVTSNVSCLPEAAGPYSLLASPSDPEDIKDKMQKALEDTSLRTRMIEGSKEFAMFAFHPHTLAHQLMNTYQKTFLQSNSKIRT